MNARKTSAMVLGMWLGLSLNGWAQEKYLPAKAPAPESKGVPNVAPAVSMAPNPSLAQNVARTLKESGQLSRYRVQVFAQGSMIDLVGDVASASQRETVIRLVRTVPGVAMVRDWIQVRPDANVITAQGPGPILQPLPIPLPPPQPLEKDKLPPPDRIDNLLPEPQPIFMGQGPNAQMPPPPMPPYAWPTFAPYNNYSRVAYPTAYPYEQWPFIGPMYPFPRVPLGWRSVTLAWEDGHWWFNRNPTGHDWWRIRYH